MPKFAKGKSGNPAGRRPGSKSHVSRELERIVKAGGGRVARDLAAKMIELALGGNVQAGKLVFERLEGRVPTAEDLANRGGATNEKLSPEQRKQKILEALRAPELRPLLEELLKPTSERVQ